MRITNNMLGQNLLRDLNTAQGKMDNLQNQMSSGYRISKPSDDPVGIESSLRLKSSLSAVEQWQRNSDEGLTTMNSTDSILGDMNSMLQRVRELAVKGANGTADPGARAAIATEVDQLAEQLEMSANSKLGNKYIFGGTKTDVEPISSLTGTWQGNSSPRSVEVGNNLNLPVSVNGETLFVNPITKHEDGTPTKGLFETLKDLSNGLKADDGSAVAATLEDIDGNIDNISAHRADLGARTNRMDSIRSQLDNTSLNLQTNLSSIQDADMGELIVEYQNQENVYKAALSVGAKIIQPSLVDFMR